MIREMGRWHFEPISSAVAGLLTFHFVCFTWIFFRAPTLEVSMSYFKGLLFGETTREFTASPLIFVMLACGAVTQFLPSQWFDCAKIWYDGAPSIIKISVPFAAILLIAIVSPREIPPFIYFQF
jgi:alginate O-acetyltransferase complex protein AlgI